MPLRFALNQSGRIIGEHRANIKPAAALAIDRAYQARRSDKNNSLDALNLGVTFSHVLTVSTQPGVTTMIEFVELAAPTGEMSAYLKCEELPHRQHPMDYRYSIRIRVDGWCECKSRSSGAGSTRYYTFRTYPQALEHARKWAKRKIAEARRA